MSRKKEALDPDVMGAPQAVKEIGRLLSDAGATFGERPYRIWDEWLSYATAAMTTGLGPFRYNTPFDRTPLVEEENRLRTKFDAKHGNIEHLLDAFRKAFGLWYAWQASNQGDLLGMIYMLYMHPSEGSGQFFTPWDVCQMMAELNIGDGARMVFDRIREAIDKLREADPLQGMLADSIMLTAAATIEDTSYTAGMEWAVVRLIPLIHPYYEPITVYDPACGSCTMLLAAAAQFPLFANRTGLVQYFGQDIDHTCVMMGTLNIMAYGLNGWGAASVLADLLAIDDPEARENERRRAEAAAQVEAAEQESGKEQVVVAPAAPRIAPTIIPGAPSIAQGPGKQMAFDFNLAPEEEPA